MSLPPARTRENGGTTLTGNGYTTGKAVGVGPQVRALAQVSGIEGITVAELRAIATEHHHGTLSGALSNLHRDGDLAMLTLKRNRCHVYVTPPNVAGRETKPHGRNNLPNINA